MFRPRFLARTAAVTIVGWISACATSPPVQEMSDARQAISAAVQADAGRFAPELLERARDFLEEAEEQLADEAYGPARMNAIRARNRAQRALETSQSAGPDAAN